MDYGFQHQGAVYTPNGTVGIKPEANEARNAAIEAAELAEWATTPDHFAAYAVDGMRITTWLGTVIGTVTHRSRYRNNLGARMECITVRGTNGATYYGRYGYGWSQLVRLRKRRA